MFNWKEMKYQDVEEIKACIERGYDALFPFGNWYVNGSIRQPVTLQACTRIFEILLQYHAMVSQFISYDIIQEMYQEMIGADYVGEFFKRLHLIEEDDWFIPAKAYILNKGV